MDTATIPLDPPPRALAPRPVPDAGPVVGESSPARETAARPSTGLAVRADPTPVQLATAVAGLLVLDLAAGIGAAETGTTLRALAAGPAIAVGTGLLTAPALVVGHQFLRLHACPEALVRALSWGFARAGAVALGLAPFALFFAATTPLWAVALGGSLLCAGALGLGRAERELRRAERAAADTGTDARRTALMVTLIGGWALLSAMVALRIAWNVATFVAGS